MLKTKNDIVYVNIYLFIYLSIYLSISVYIYTQYIYIYIYVQYIYNIYMYIYMVCLFDIFKNLAGTLVIWFLFNFIDIYKSVTNYKNNSQMFEIFFHVELLVSFSFFPNSGTTCCLHCSSEAKVAITLFNESSLLNKMTRDFEPSKSTRFEVFYI